MNTKKFFKSALCGIMSAVMLGSISVYADDASTANTNGSVVINDSNFPDENFRNYVKTFDTSEDGSLAPDEIAKVTTIDVSNSSGIDLSDGDVNPSDIYIPGDEPTNPGDLEPDTENYIYDLKGIEYFTALTNLYCNNNYLKSMDLSKNTELTELECDGNSLTSIDVSKNTKLSVLSCYYNSIESLDLSKNTNLTKLICNNNKLTTLDLSQNTKLTDLSCDYNQITTLDLSKNTGLTELSCGINKLTELDLSKNTALKYLNCIFNNLVSLNLNNCTALETVYCNGNQLKSLDLSSNTALTEMVCINNQLTSLDISKNTKLTDLRCSENPLTNLDIASSAVTTLYAETTEKDHAYKAVFNDGKFDLSTLSGFDVSKASDWTNAVIDGSVITVTDPDQPVTYKYDTGKGTATFMIVKSTEVTGDTNYDGVLNVRDAAYIAKKLAEGKGNELPMIADFNGDGKVDVRDAAAIARYLANSFK